MAERAWTTRSHRLTLHLPVLAPKAHGRILFPSHRGSLAQCPRLMTLKLDGSVVGIAPHNFLVEGPEGKEPAFSDSLQ